MGAQFEPAVEVVLLHEGGWVCDPADPGGETNHGISQVIIKLAGLTPADCGVADFSPGALKAMPVENAKAIYRRCFWEPLGLDRIEDQRRATKIMDCAVNCGQTVGVRLAQYACERAGRYVAPDGILGPVTVEAINACDGDVWMRAYCSEQAWYYKALIVKKPQLQVFARNWSQRAGWGCPPVIIP
jgi:lysozyme family protein